MTQIAHIATQTATVTVDYDPASRTFQAHGDEIDTVAASGVRGLMFELSTQLDPETQAALWILLRGFDPKTGRFAQRLLKTPVFGQSSAPSAT